MPPPAGPAVDQDVPFLALDVLAAIEAQPINLASLFRALDALAVDDRCRRAHLATHQFAAADVQGVVQPGEGAVVLPATRNG